MPFAMAKNTQMHMHRIHGTYLSHRPGLPGKLARHSSCHICTKQRLGIHLVVHVHMYHVKIVCKLCQLLHQGGLTAICIRSTICRSEQACQCKMRCCQCQATFARNFSEQTRIGIHFHTDAMSLMLSPPLCTSIHQTSTTPITICQC